MSDKRTYIVETEYKVKDEASHGLEKIGDAAEHAHEHAESLREVLKEVGETFLIFEGVEKAKELFVGFNSEVEVARVQLQTLIGVNFKKSWESAGESAGEFYEEFEKFAETFPVSANQMVASAQLLGSAVSQAGGDMEDLMKLTEEAAVAEKTLGLNTSQLMMAMRGMVSSRNIGGMALLGAVGMTPEQWRKLTNESRLKLTEQALGSEVFKKAGEAYAGTFASQASILKDRLEVAAGKVGLPLFKALTQELQRWNEWLDKNSQKIESMSHSIASGLVKGFEVLKDVAGFIYDHSDILIKIAEAWALAKFGSAIGDIKGAIGGSKAGELADKIGSSMAKYLPGLSKLGGGLGSILGGAAGWAPLAIPAGQILGDALGNAVFPTVRRFEELQAASQHLSDVLAETAREGEKNHKGTPLGSHAAGLALGVAEYDKQQIEELERLKSVKHLGDNDEKRLRNLGFSEDEIHPLFASQKYRGETIEKMIGQRQRGIDLRDYRIKQASSQTERGLDWTMSKMSKDQREHLNVAKATQMIMEKQLQMWTLGPNGLSGRLLTLEEMEQIIKESGLTGEQAKINQTVNVTIQQVSAKDPDRWIADMDEYAARRVRARTKAKGALARGH